MELSKSIIRKKFFELDEDFDKLLAFYYSQGQLLRPVFRVIQLFPEYGNQKTINLDMEILSLKQELGL